MENNKFSNEQIAQLLAINLVSKKFESKGASTLNDAMDVVKEYKETLNNLIRAQKLMP